MQLQPRTLRMVGGIGAALVPVGYITAQHVSWERRPQSKKRMLAHHVFFWSSLAAGLVLAHKTHKFRGENATWKKIAAFTASALLPVLGFEGGGKLALKLFPKLPYKKPAAQVPAYLQAGNYQPLQPSARYGLVFQARG